MRRRKRNCKQIDENNAKVKADDERRAELEKKQAEAEEKLREIMYVIPNIVTRPSRSGRTTAWRQYSAGDPVVPDF